MRKFLSLCLLLVLLSPVCISAKEYQWAEGGDEPTKQDLILNREQVKSYLEGLKKNNDSRQVFNSSSPEFLESYGKLFVGGVQKCTGNIVSNKPTNDNYIVTSSAHCFETDTPEDVSIVFLKRNGDVIKRKLALEIINRVHDYAILRLDRKIDNRSIKPLLLTPYSFEDLIDEAELLDLDAAVVSTAGYSSDEHLGKNGKVLTSDQGCLSLGWVNNFRFMTDCTAYPGASGGAAVVSLDDGEFHVDYFVGVNASVSFGFDDEFSSRSYSGDLTRKAQRLVFVDVRAMYADLINALGCAEDDIYDFFEIMGW